jgi:hypothetical protein
MDDELLSSWLSRAACRYDLDGGTLRDLLTAPGGDAKGRAGLDGLDYRPTGEELAALAAAARLAAKRLSALVLATVHPTWPRHWFAWSWGALDPVDGTDLYADALAPG